MKRYFSAAAIAVCALLVQTPSMAQDKPEKEKSKDKMGEYDEIIIKRKDGKDGKVTIEIKDGEVTVNGKPIDDFDDQNLSVRKKKSPHLWAEWSITVPLTKFQLRRWAKLYLGGRPAFPRNYE